MRTSTASLHKLRLLHSQPSAGNIASVWFSRFDLQWLKQD